MKYFDVLHMDDFAKFVKECLILLNTILRKYSQGIYQLLTSFNNQKLGFRLVLLTVFRYAEYRFVLV